MGSYPGSLIRSTPPTPTALVASGVWTIKEAMQYKALGIWPTRETFPADAFLDFNGSNGSQTFVDAKGHTMAAGGNAQLSTAQFKSGPTSLLCDGTGDSARITYAADLLLGTADFAIAFWYRPAAGQTQAALMGSGGTASNTGWMIRIDTTTGRINYQSRAGAVSLTGPTMVVGTWYHIYWGRASSTYYYSTDGAGTIGVSGTNGGNNFSSATDIWIGADNGPDFGGANGNFDDVLLNVGSNMFTANYAVPQFPYNVT